MGLPAANSTPARRTNRDRRRELSSAAIPQPREFAHHLIERRIDVVGELDLGYRFQPIHAHADRRGDDAALGNRRVDHPVLAVLALQPVCAPKHAAEVPDVLAHENDPRIALEHDVHRRVDRLNHVHMCHGRQSCFAGRMSAAADSVSARNSSRCRTRCCGILAYTSSNIVAGSSLGPSVIVP